MPHLVCERSMNALHTNVCDHIMRNSICIVGFVRKSFCFFGYCNISLFLGGKYEPYLSDNAYKIHMKLTIKAMSKSDFGVYKCVSKNSLGDTDGTIKVYREYLLFILFR